MKILSKKIASIFLTFSIVSFSIVLPKLPVFASATNTSQILYAAKSYVTEQKNAATMSGLLTAVKTVDSSVTLAADDYFMKHAVPGVKDDDTVSGYPISIPGSDGAVAAIFYIGDTPIAFSCGIPHTEEVIHINEVAVVGTGEGFKYSGKDVIGYNGTADKIVFPASYHGAMTKLSDKSSVDNVKAVLIDTDDKNETWQTCARLKEYSYSGWKSLVAVEFGENAHPRMLFDNATKNESGENLYPDSSVPGIFKECPNLKYVKLPRKLYASQYTISGSMFENCKNLENVIFYENSANDNKPFANRAFAYTNLRDVFLPSWAALNETQQANAFYGAECRHTERGGQVINYSENMSYIRAITLATAKASEFSRVANVQADSALAEIRASITGSANAESLRNSLTYEWNDSFTVGTLYNHGNLTVSDGNIPFEINVQGAIKGLKGLSVSGFKLSPEFSPSVYEYDLVVPNGTKCIKITAEADNGITTSINGNNNFTVGENNVTVTAHIDSDTDVVYRIRVIVENSKEDIDNLRLIASSYVSAVKNDLTAESLLAEIRETYPSVQLDSENDFFIKHAVPGVSDNDTESGYQLNIPGSNGAVAAVFVLNGQRITFNQAFPHSTETISIKKTAIVGIDDGFTYTESQVNGKTVRYITNYTGTADKIVFPKDKPITMAEKPLQAAHAFNNIKVVIIDTSDTTSADRSLRLQNSAFSEWASLRAVQFGANAHGRLLIDNISGKYPDGCVPSLFAACPSLKYVKLFENCVGFLYALPSGIFRDCQELENVNIPNHDSINNLPLAGDSFKYTAVRDFILPERVTANDIAIVPLSKQTGTHNIISYTQPITLCRAIALCTAQSSQTDSTAKSIVETKILSAISGSIDADNFANSLISNTVWKENGLAVTGTLSVSDGRDTFAINYRASKAELGDVTEDGKIDLLDLICMKKKIVNGTFQNISHIFDINTDHVINAQDLTLLKRTLLGSYNITHNAKMFVKWDNEELYVVQKYSSQKDFVMVMKKQGGNHIFNIASPLAISNTSATVSSDLTNAVAMSNLGVSDWFGPHRVYAKANKDGSKPGAWSYTGGSHNFNNNENYGESSTTGRTEDIVITVDGVKVNDGFTGFADDIIITWDNYIQGFNTMKTDGTGREILKEHHTFSYNGDAWNTQTDIEFLEQSGWANFYGNQCVVNNLWHDAIKYGNEPWQPMNDHTKATTQNCDRILIRGANGDYLEMGIDNSYGIGDRSLLGAAEPGAFHKHYGNDKAYFNLVSGDHTMEAGQKVSYRGYYRFFVLE